MKIKCLGGFREVGRSAVLLEDKHKILLDYGIDVEHDVVPIKPGNVDHVLITHPHLDHVGMAPSLYKFKRPPIYGTISMFDQAYLLLRDAIKVARINRKIQRYDIFDIKKLSKAEVDITPGQTFEIEDKACTVYNAGHVPGSVSYLIEKNKSILYTGDFNTRSTRLVKGANIKCKNIDLLITESTYAFKNHPPRKQVEDKFLETIKNTLDNEGIALVPAFAVGRAQEILMVLQDFNKKYPVYLDGMAKDATQIALRYPEFIADHKALKKALNKVIPLYTNRDRKMAISHPSIIVTTGGMMSGGPVVWYMKKLYNKPECSVNLTGYCVESTPGKILLETGKFVHENLKVKVRMSINKFDFSVTPDTIILARDSKKTKLCPISDIEENFDKDTLETYAFDKSSMKSGWYKVNAIIKHKYSGKIYKIITKSGRSVKITQGHSIFVLKNGKINDIPGEKIEIGNYVIIPNKINAESYNDTLDVSNHFKYNSSTAPHNIPITNDLCRLLGYYVAEGHCIDRVGISLNNQIEQNIANEIRGIINSIFPNLQVVNYYPNPSELQLRFGGTLTARIFEDLCGNGSHNKKVPDFIFQCDKRKILEFVGAYLTGDGWFEGGKIRAKSTSKRLIDELLYLLLYSGIIAKYDGIRISKERVTPQGRIFKKSVSHVLRIQRIDDIKIVSEFLRGKIKDSVDEYIKNNNKTTSSPPHGLPVRELNIKDSLSKYNWRIEKILKSSSRNHISPKFIEIDNIKDDFLKKMVHIIKRFRISFSSATNVKYLNL